VKVLLDSSAWIAHLFGEAGADEVNQLLSDATVDTFISAPSMLEVYGQLKAIGRGEEWTTVFELYRPLFQQVMPVDERVTKKAIELREATSVRLPTIDCLIAATACVHHLTLVHRDSHFSSIPQQLLTCLVLPAN
jgi:predicted nucleic acid-binding protein